MADPIDRSQDPPDGLYIIKDPVGGDEGVSRTELSRFLGCTPAALQKVLEELGEEPVGWGVFIQDEFPLYHWTLALTLQDNEGVVESRRLRDKYVTPNKRQSFLKDFISDWETEGAELVGLRIGAHKSVQDLDLGLGACTVLMGPNGAGKTNILEAIALGGGSDRLVNRLRPSSTPSPPKSGSRPDVFWCIFRLRPTDEDLLESFLDRFVRGKGAEGPVGQHLRRILSTLFRRPIVYLVYDHNRDASLAVITADRETVSELSEVYDEIAGLPIPKDPWIEGLIAALKEEGRSLLIALPTTLDLDLPKVEIVDGDPTRLAADLVAEIPPLAQRLWAGHYRKKPNMPLVVDLASEVLLAEDDGRTLAQVPECPWIAWLATARGTNLDRASVLRACETEDFDLIRLGSPSAFADWLAVGVGKLRLRNVVEASLVSKRSDARRLLQESAVLYISWILGLEEDDREEAEQSAPAQSFVSTLDALYAGLGFGVAGQSSTTGWLAAGESGAVIPAPIVATLRMVEESANQLAPPFVREQGRILVSALPPETWQGGEPAVRLSFAGSGSRLYEIPETGRGAQRWIAASIREAVRKLQSSEITGVEGEEFDTDTDPSSWFDSVEVVESGAGAKPSLLLIDEPELSLHPQAQEQVAAWCVEASRLGQTVVVATHSPAMLDLPPSEAALAAVSMIDGRTRVAPIDVAALAGLDELGRILGLGRPALLQLIRGFVLVEGTTDKAVLKSLLGVDLAAHRVEPIPLHGYFRAQPLFANPELAAAIGKPLAVLFDDVKREVLEGNRGPESGEEKELLRLREFQLRFPQVRELSFDAPDIICALPDDAVRRVRPGFTSWDSLLASWDREGTKFKHHVLKALGRKIEQSEIDLLVRETLDAVLPEDPLPAAFERTAQELRAWMTSIGSYGWELPEGGS